MWNSLIEVLRANHSALSPSDRSSLLDDAFALAGGELLPYETVLELCTYLSEETHYIPWKTVASQLGGWGGEEFMRF